MMNVDEYYRWGRLFDMILPDGVTDEVIAKALQSLNEVWIARLEVAKGVPWKDLSSLLVPRLDGKGNLKSCFVKGGVRRAFNKLRWSVTRVLSHREALKRDASGQTQELQFKCPHCGAILEVRGAGER